MVTNTLTDATTTTYLAHGKGQKTHGPWGHHTATIDWCEDNYVHTDYIAETWNALSSVSYISFGLYGIYRSKGLEKRASAVLAYGSMVLIGMGSAIFHGTLLWHAQVLLDELPMIWATAFFVYVSRVGRAPHGTLQLKMVMITTTLAISAIYLKYPNPTFHQLAFGALLLYAVRLVTQHQKAVDLSTPDRAARYERGSRVLVYGIVAFIVGFALWNIDNVFCDALSRLRDGRGETVGLLTQGHAWWHFLGAVGIYYIATSTVYLILALSSPDGYELVGLLPYVRKRTVMQKWGM